MASDNEVNDLIGRLSGLTPDQRARIDDAIFDLETGTPTPGSAPLTPAASGKFQVTKAQMRDPEWCRVNHAARARALKAGTLEIVD